MFNIGIILLDRISTLLALKALPDEAALQAFMRSAFKGMAFLIVGSVLMGAAIAASLYIAYDQMISIGYQRSYTLIGILLTALVLVAICFFLADKWFSQRFRIKKQKVTVDSKINDLRAITGESITGFIEGFCDRSKPRLTKDRR